MAINSSPTKNRRHKKVTPETEHTQKHRLSLPGVLNRKLSLVVVGQLGYLVAEPIVHAVDPPAVPQSCSSLATYAPRCETMGHGRYAQDFGMVGLVGVEKNRRAAVDGPLQIRTRVLP